MVLTPGDPLLLRQEIHRGAQRDGKLQSRRIVCDAASRVCKALQCHSLHQQLALQCPARYVAVHLDAYRLRA